jgi:hypothetical protein
MSSDISVKHRSISSLPVKKTRMSPVPCLERRETSDFGTGAVEIKLPAYEGPKRL